MKQTERKGKVCSSSKEECNSEMDIMLKCKYNYALSFSTDSNCPVLVRLRWCAERCCVCLCWFVYELQKKSIIHLT